MTGRYILAATLLGSAVLDALTMLALPLGAELNPIAATMPLVAVGLKLAAATVIAALLLRQARYFRAVALIGSAAWSVGAISNLLVLT